MLLFHTQTCACMGSCRALPVPGGEYRIACPFRYRACAFKYGAPTAPQCPNGVQIWGRAAPAVSKGVHHGLYHRTQRVRRASILSVLSPGGFPPLTTLGPNVVNWMVSYSHDGIPSGNPEVLG